MSSHTAAGKIKADREANARLRTYLDKEADHFRLGRDWDGVDTPIDVQFKGHARDLHGPGGVCTCCYGRTP